MQYAMIIDYGFCTGCRSCEISCRNEHDIPLKEWGIKVMDSGPEKLGGEWEWDFIPVPSRLCDLCVERLEDGNIPACELHCLAKVIEVVPLEKVAPKMAQRGKKMSCYLP
jgi:Fe-S-cluster-containing dehydrogenase component